MGWFGNLKPPEVVLLGITPLSGGGGVVAGVPPQLSFHPGHQLQGVEWLCEVVVRPQGQPHDLVHVLHLGGEHEDGEQVVLPDLLAQGEPVHVREHHVQNGQVQVGALHTGEGLLSGIKLVDGVALVFQADLHQVGDGRLVVYH